MISASLKALVFRSQHSSSLLQTQVPLLPNWHQRFCKMLIVLSQQSIHHLHIADKIAKHQRLSFGIFFFASHKRDRVVLPMSPWIQVMRCVTTVTEGISVTSHINESDTGPQIRIRLRLIDKRMLASSLRSCQPHNKQRHDQHTNRRPIESASTSSKINVELPHSPTAHLSASLLWPFRPAEIERKLNPNKQSKAGKLSQKSENRVASVSGG